MPKGKPLVELLWQPQLLIPSSSKATDACHNKPQNFTQLTSWAGYSGGDFLF
ncbi:hypothetical protein HN51_050739, partial [Arachis hypogaea]